LPRFLALLCLISLALPIFPQEASPQTPQTSEADITTADRFWVSGQANFITQYNPSFPAKYSGPNSFGPASEAATSRVLTLYTGIRLTRTTDFLFDLEETGGGGLSAALGIAGFTNLDVVRNPTLGQAPYVARILLHQTIPLSHTYTESVRGPLGLAPQLPVRRLELHLGKLSTADFFDINGVGSDSHLQFMNWAADNDPAYDYAADTRGYTYGFVAEYYDRNWELRFGEMLMPTVANGIKLDWDLARARGQNLEFEIHPEIIAKKQSAIRVLAFANTANMGSYNEAIQQYQRGEVSTPDIVATRHQGRVKYGFGLNVEQELGGGWRVYSRLGWNEGRNETFAYTEADNHVSAGADLRGTLWHRAEDKWGAAFLSNGISQDHRRYLALGGLGFILGDGGLTYAREQILETYYNLHVWRGIFLAGDLQHVWSPGYNQDRGPVLVASFRLHLEDAVSFGRKEKN
jgi:high affinity Mn2+ porin